MKYATTSSAMALVLGLSAAAQASTVTPDIIFGSKVDNGGFTLVQKDSVEIGLRAKLRYDTNGQPQNIFPWDGTNTYAFQPSDGIAQDGNAIWNYEWSVNTNVDGNGGNLNLYTYEIDISGPNGFNRSFNPFQGLFPTLGPLPTAVSFGTNTTANGNGQARTPFQTVFGIIPGNRNVAQTSSNIGFSFYNNSDPGAEGEYKITLSVFFGDDPFASNTIFVTVGELSPTPIPLPAGGVLLLSALAGFGLVRQRKTAQTPA